MSIGIIWSDIGRFLNSILSLQPECLLSKATLFFSDIEAQILVYRRTSIVLKHGWRTTKSTKNELET